ncbi:protein-arginine N-methyltransferase SFM1 KNAG_0C06120 [Huiozyma naganishii CBS 8797]|uniref:Uncharacterized protein n=1 Tax=Huiozyma naganishii (strain ATCC MYA-139 / BCRC 22969 / CBS 8797 / KCTC 17520 / NBRC 10181 / NCYC 3082 / Yp74L-3) TaxID=1071383 RepID=J7RJL7_HUIN7|nr:hypothetical protein KNAG_0C06120 [Kazachstania naganishii CBS 8797]CCK69708.1 hypothetical protein KNAG_0C06120 [Kazachstania naganishii CBS 8797]
MQPATAHRSHGPVSVETSPPTVIGLWKIFTFNEFNSAMSNGALGSTFCSIGSWRSILLCWTIHSLVPELITKPLSPRTHTLLVPHCVKEMKYVIEHMEDGFSEWVILEYLQILRDVGRENLHLTSLPEGTKDQDIPQRLRDAGLQWSTGGLKSAAETGSPAMVNGRVCLLDPRAEQDLSPEDATQFDYFVFGGILGDHPPRDRTSELKEMYPGMLVGRRLGDKQMTTDTAVRTTQLVLRGQQSLSRIQFVDYPEFRFSKHEATEMPFRYVADTASGKPILPEGMMQLIKEDSQQTLDDLLL